MALNIRTSSGLQPVKTISVRTVSGLSTVKAITVYGKTGAVTAPSSGAASVSPKSASGFANAKGNVRIITSSVTVVTTGGTGPFQIAWTVSDTTWSVTNPSGSSTAFRSPPLVSGQDAETTAFATVTDATGTPFKSNTIVVSAGNIGQ